MARKRMFNNKITESDAFLDMPLSAQALYLHLNMTADDDGFINNSKRTQRFIGASDSDMQALEDNGFIIRFGSGIVAIKHWLMHNTIQKDRYIPTTYIEEKSCLAIKENKAYTIRKQTVSEMDTKCIQTVSEMDTKCKQNVSKTDTNCKQNVPKMDTKCIQNVSKMETQNRLDKNSIDKNKYTYDFEETWKVYPRKDGKEAAYRAYSARIKEGEASDRLLEATRNYANAMQGTENKYIKLGSTFFGRDHHYKDYITEAPKAEAPQPKEMSDAEWEALVDSWE